MTRALASLEVGLAICQEAKATGDFYPRVSGEYRILCSDAPSAHQGGLALVWIEDHDAFEVEAANFCTPNVLTFELVTGGDRYFVVGCYIAPTDTETVNHVRAAWNACPEGCIPLLLGDLNASLWDPVSPRDDAIADMTDEANIVDLSRHFLQRRCRRQGGEA